MKITTTIPGITDLTTTIITKVHNSRSGRVQKVSVKVKSRSHRHHQRHHHDNNNNNNDNQHGNSLNNSNDDDEENEEEEEGAEQLQKQQQQQHEASSSETWRQTDRALDAYVEETHRLLFAVDVDDAPETYDVHGDMADLAALLPQ